MRRHCSRVGDSFLSYIQERHCRRVDDVLPLAERHRFLDDTVRSPDVLDDIAKTLAKADVAKALSHLPADARDVWALVERGDGVVHTNEKIVRLLRIWMPKRGAGVTTSTA